MNSPFFSIITCTYNSEKYLKKNINSVKNQNYKNFEHIFIDGFSTDSTLDIIKKYQSDFPNKVKFFQFTPEGISRAMNQGIEKSNGQYLIHLHSDDSFFNDNVLGDVIEFLGYNNYPDWIYGKIDVKGNNKKGIFPEKSIWQKQRNKYFSGYLLKFYNYIPHQAVFIQKKVFARFGLFDQKLSSGMDYDLWLRIRSKTDWIFFNKVISNFTLRRDAQSSGFINKFENKNNQSMVRKRHLKKIEIILANLIDLLFMFKKSNYQK